ncbi:MAG: hypothetical protein GY804_04640 [Alphaproteobacteria bacterium]|nr:hypothetical protein [Alphaproteobacteria bacterium]
MQRDVECPYCGTEQDICHDDGYGYEEDRRHEQQCCGCEKYFTFTTAISFDYEANKADCLNDAPHDYKPTTTFPKIATMMQCETCDERRKPTKEEMAEILAV